MELGKADMQIESVTSENFLGLRLTEYKMMHTRMNDRSTIDPNRRDLRLVSLLKFFRLRRVVGLQ